jgi:penicillin-binding protein 1A
MWIYFMEKALQGRPETPPIPPNGLVTVKIDPKTGLLARPDQKDSIYEIFTQETVPTEVAPHIVNDSIDNSGGVESIF